MNPNDSNKLRHIIVDIAKILTAKLKTLDHTQQCCIIVYDPNEPGKGSFFSSTEPTDIVSALRETADNIEKQEHVLLPICNCSHCSC